MKRALPFALVAIAACAVGYVFGASGRKPEARSEPIAARCESETLAAAMSRAQIAIDTSALRDDLRKIVREELAAAGHGGKDRAPQTETAERPAPTSQEAVSARETSERLIATSLSTHRWTREQKAQLRDLLPQMTDDQRAATLAELIPAMNRQEIIPDEPGPPF